MNKQALAEQLVRQLRVTAVAAENELRASAKLAEQDTLSRTDREDARTATGNGGMVRGQKRRADQARNAVSTAEAFKPRTFNRKSEIGVGALVDIEDEETGEGRTLFLAPIGAGLELTGPDGDGFFSVITPSSPMGRASLGKRVGDGFDILVAGKSRSWEITWVS